MNKKEQRYLCLNARNKLSAEERKNYSKTICDKLSKIVKDGLIFSYLPYGSEVDVTDFNESHDVCYPVVFPEGKMVAYKDSGHFRYNSLKIKEPDPQYSQAIDPSEISTIIVPCVGFDEKKNRLGHGGGYYDRYLKDSKALKILVAYEAQKLDEIICEENDIRPDLIITEKDSY